METKIELRRARKTNDRRRVERARSKRKRLDPKILSVNEKGLDSKDVDIFALS